MLVLILKLWARQAEPTDDQLNSSCKNAGMYHSLTSTLTDVLKRHKTNRLFVLSHPKIRKRINQMLTGVSLW